MVAMGDQSVVRQKSIRILIHGEDGLFPFLSPRILMKYFPPNDTTIQNHVILGVAVKETCIVPVYLDAGDLSVPKLNKKRKMRDGINNVTKRVRKDDNVALNCSVETKLNSIPDDIETEDFKKKIASRKPIGFTFKGMSISKHLRLLPGYMTMAVPTFDLLDDLKLYNDAVVRNNAKNKKQKFSGSLAQISSTHEEISLCTPKGIQKISPELYTESVHGLQCDSFVGLFDQVHSTDGKRRKLACGERAHMWLNRCLDHLERVGKGKPVQKVFAPVVCQVGEKEFKETIANIISHEKKLAGIALVGWHYIASRQDRVSILKQISNPIHPLSKSILQKKDLAVIAVSDMKQFLDAVRGGVNVIGTTLPASLARSKRGLMLDLKSWCEDIGEDNREGNGKLNKLDDDGCRDLSCVTFRRDATVLVPGCSCPSCSEDKHTRAYIHHLINCKELLADILLFSHNLHQIILLCKEISSAREKGQLERFLNYIEDQLG